MPLDQPGGPFGLDSSVLVVRTDGDVQALLPVLRESIRAIDPAVPVSNVNTFTWQVRGLVMPQRMGATLFGVAAALALTLAAIGIYGVASYVDAAAHARDRHPHRARRRSRAHPALVLRQGSIPVAAGIAGGLVIAAAGSRVAAAFLRGVPPRDPLTYAARRRAAGRHRARRHVAARPPRRAAQSDPGAAAGLILRLTEGHSSENRPVPFSAWQTENRPVPFSARRRALENRPVPFSALATALENRPVPFSARRNDTGQTDLSPFLGR